MCSSLLSCPLCCLSSFPDLETFKLNLIKVNSKPIKCPFPTCDEILLGLDKLTIHLFGHSLPAEELSQPQIHAKRAIEPKLCDLNELEPVQHKEINIIKAKTSAIPLLNHHVKSTGVSSTSTVTSGESTLRCEICGFVFYDENLLSLHLSLVHNFLPSYREHVEMTNNVIENCAISNNPNLSQTSEGEAGEEIKKFHCHLCSKHFKMKGALRIHIRVAHIKFQDQNKRQINIANYLRTQKSLMNATSDSQLDQCTVKTENLTIQEPSSPQTSAVNSPAGLQQVHSPSADKPPKLHTCEDCKKTFTSKYFLKKHKRLHTGEMPYTCEQCGKSFFFQQSYHKHLNYHNDEKPYECSECGRNFKELSTLHNHERIHSGLKPFGCEICGKFFRQKVSYLVHTRIHTGVLPYKCTECGKSFRYKVSKRSHKCTGSVEPASPDEVIQKLMQDTSISQPADTKTSTKFSSTTTITADVHSNSPFPQAKLITPSQQELCLDDLIKDDSFEKFLKQGDQPMSIMAANQHQFIPEISCLPENNSFNQDFAFDFHNNVNNMGTMNSYFEPLESNFDDNFQHSVLETINEDSIKELLALH